MLKQNFEKPCKSIQIGADAYRSENKFQGVNKNR
jgi:hypothetical protein